ncbi:MFS transporter [Pseudomonas viridiflava]|uniref:MFS transporter n=1 Tax=Pseudomonas viridiflava TaxID=33069 RepID=UPI000F022340|nr:MFS transporter [Pseudomonas viridiflava]
MTPGLPRRTYLYFAAQSINLTTAVMSVTMAAMVGSILAPAVTLSTVPYGFQFLFLLMATYPASWLMSRLGRKRCFLLGSIPLALSGMVGYWGVQENSFSLLIISHSALGVYIAFANFNRFAATDNLDQKLKPKALSLVVAGGVIAAVAGPALTELLRDLNGFQAFSLCYASFIALALISALITLCLPSDLSAPPINRSFKANAGEAKKALSKVIVISMAVAALGYGIMNVLMIQASIHMKHMHHDFSDVRLAIQWHVIAMFAPSFVTGAIIQKLGIKLTICSGLVMLSVCAAINLGSGSYAAMTFALIVLGLGWNLTYVGGGALLAESLTNNPQAFLVQGKNDLAIAMCATLGAFSPALLLGYVGWDGTNFICIVFSLTLLVITCASLSSGAAKGSRAEESSL